jgi:hypothetical protein
MKFHKADQTTIFDWLKKTEALARQMEGIAKGSLDIDKELRAALSDDIKHACADKGRELSRAEVAARMTDLIGEEITLSMLNNWTAPSHPHSIPSKWIPAFVLATGGQRRSIEVISKHSGLFLLPGPEALRAEIQRHDEIIQKNKTEKLKKMIFLKEIEK